MTDDKKGNDAAHMTSVIRRSSSAVFLDRDGVLNANVYYADTQEWESPRTLQEFQLLPGTVPALRRLHDAGYALFIVTNQPSYAKGKVSLMVLKKILALTERTLAAAGIPIVKTYCSFHHPQSIIPELAAPCRWRKPNPGALLDAIQDYRLRPDACWMIGDRATDTECARAAGVRGIRIAQAQVEDPNAAACARNLAEAVAIILHEG